MIKRELQNKILQLATKFPVVSVTGPRQSGKTTLIKSTFPDYKYRSLEDPDIRIESKFHHLPAAAPSSEL